MAESAAEWRNWNEWGRRAVTGRAGERSCRGCERRPAGAPCGPSGHGAASILVLSVTVPAPGGQRRAAGPAGASERGDAAVPGRLLEDVL